jgi:hypothetical protein
MTDIIWINPVVQGSCTPDAGCGSACCQFRVYTDANNYTVEWCQYYNTDPTVTLKCRNYDNRWPGCRRYPDERMLRMGAIPPNCGYRLEED